MYRLDKGGFTEQRAALVGSLLNSYERNRLVATEVYWESWGKIVDTWMSLIMP